MTPGFAFLDQEYYDQLQTVPWLDKDRREATPKLEELACSNKEPTNHEKVCQLSQGQEKGASPRGSAKVRILNKDEPVDPTEFPVTDTEKLCPEIPRLTENEQLALAKVTKADSPFVSSVVREDERMIPEPPAEDGRALRQESKRRCAGGSLGNDTSCLAWFEQCGKEMGLPDSARTLRARLLQNFFH